ncbi:Lipase member J [Camelus dromedarius]|uniref:Lipase member J n=1 Tax=Camelus dromedarius TaxID=9838 RepID=A0A5N4DIP1_CAMDR|nr:Lipase member J [Camelus dromedarius]
MWYLFKMLSFILIFGTTHGTFQNRRPVNPEANMNISQIISYWGYPDEEYDITTEDGYILGLYRIPYGKTNSDNSSAQRLVVYLQHGLLTSASSWISNLPNSSLGFLLADAGYDVWMGNSRGTTWSRKHLYLETNSKEFWAFRIGDSLKWKNFTHHMYGNGSKEHRTTPTQTPTDLVQRGLLCNEYLTCISCHCNEQMSIFLTLPFFFQLLNSSHLKAFDWGSPVLNLVHFNQTTSPLYNVANMNVSTATWSGESDLLADPEDVNILLPEIRNHIYHKTISYYNHIDFLFGLDVYHQVYHEIIDIIQGNL